MRAFLLVILHAYRQRRNTFTVHPGRIVTNVHTIRQRLQPANKRRQRFNRKTLPPCLTHSPTIQRRKAGRNHCRQFRQPGPNQPPQFAPTGQRFPAFPAGYLRTIQATRAGTLARLLAYLCMNALFFAYSQRKLYTIFDMRPGSLDFAGFQGARFIHSPAKSFYPGKPRPQSLDFTAFAGTA